jgi:acyl carrier protein
MRERIKNVLKNVFDLSEVDDDISSKTCAEWDSMHHFQMVVELESEFDISITPEEIEIIKDIEMIETILKLKRNK